MPDWHVVDVLIRNSHSHGEGQGPGPSAPVSQTLVGVLVGIETRDVEFSVSGMLVNGKERLGNFYGVVERKVGIGNFRVKKGAYKVSRLLRMG